MNKILIANRAEIACRIIRSCRALGLATVAIYSEADAHALHVAMADEAHCVGAAPARESYLRSDRILEAAASSGADAVHPGYGFLAENARFAQAVIDSGLIWIGPLPETIADMGEKDKARTIAEAAGLPVLPGSRPFAGGELEGLLEAARKIGYPLLVKASAGGGGIGMRRVEDPEKLLEVAEATQSMAEKSFGDGTIYLERYLPKARHIEVQVFGFGDGRAVDLHERDCSIQRRFQKVVEESPAPGLPDVVRKQMSTAASALCHHQRYRGAGTIEFIVDAETFDFYFLEMNTRIQVEHPVTEMTTGLDLVAMQIELAQGTLAPVEQRDVRHRGHAIECRIYAENPAKNFRPSPGTLARFELPAREEGVRIETGFRTGDRITVFYDPMIAKVICRAATRGAAIDRMLAALAATSIEGLATNVPFLMATINHPAFREGKVFTGFIDAYMQELVSFAGS
ncbi:MAG: biotin carboxylase N-terminal domain-containing protein [Casimicrobiaceae bacterium]|nr:acetyl-CoA carboxylase biotin carboxylase subunit [Pseudomonadota bacterium]